MHIDEVRTAKIGCLRTSNREASVSGRARFDVVKAKMTEDLGLEDAALSVGERCAAGLTEALPSFETSGS